MAQGIDKIPLRIPAQWSAEWFERFVRDVLAPADIRNATEGLGISITGQSNEPATVSASEDFQQLFDADFLLAEADTALLPNARTLAVANGVSMTDAGAGGAVTLGVSENGLSLDRLQQVSPRSVLANDSASPDNIGVILAGSDDTILCRVGGALEFGQLTADMAPDDLWPYAKLDTGVQASLDLADTAVQEGDSPDFVGVNITEGANARMGVATLVAGTVTINTTAVTANSRIFLAAQALGTVTVPQALAVSARVAGTSFTILSSDLTDTSSVAWLIMEPA